MICWYCEECIKLRSLLLLTNDEMLKLYLVANYYESKIFDIKKEELRDSSVLNILFTTNNLTKEEVHNTL